MDKFQFAKLVSFITSLLPTGAVLNNADITCLDELVKPIEPDQYHKCYTNAADLDALMGFMKASTQKIEAIKMHRQLTGLGLKESKDAVERYWKVDNAHNL